RTPGAPLGRRRLDAVLRRFGDRSLDAVDVADRAGVCRGRHRGVGAEGGGDDALAGDRDVAVAGEQGLAALLEDRVVDLELDRAVGDVDRDGVAVLDQGDRAAGRRL